MNHIQRALAQANKGKWGTGPAYFERHLVSLFKKWSVEELEAELEADDSGSKLTNLSGEGGATVPIGNLLSNVE